MSFDELDDGTSAGLAKNVLAFVDEQLKRISEQIARDMEREADSSLFEDVEYLAGIGFVACQRYATYVCGKLKVRKDEAFTKGPKLPSGVSYVSVFNAAANYWKHSDEWNWATPDRFQLRTKLLLEQAGVKISEGFNTAAWNVLHQLDLGNFATVTSILSQ